MNHNTRQHGQQNQWRDGDDMNPDSNNQNKFAQQGSYGEANAGNLTQSDKETGKDNDRDHDEGGYGKVGNTGGGNKDWESHGSSDNDMGRNNESRSFAANSGNEME